ncbi:MAG: hypothetical protein WA655_14000 [Candidatus Korobacteraceae bacterium]
MASRFRSFQVAKYRFHQTQEYEHPSSKGNSILPQTMHESGSIFELHGNSDANKGKNQQ